MVKPKKGQMKVQQMAFMMIGLAIFFILVGLFALSFILSGLKDSKALLDEQRATLLAGRLADSPEFSCANAYGTGKSNCVDMDKVFALKNKIDDYSGFWGVLGIEIFRLYPYENQTLECDSSNYPYCGHITILKPKNLGTDNSAYVSLCRKEKNGNSFYNKCEIGELVVRISDE
ncbi:hypothetical protein J4411_02540 [Candidatus Pacearchaeota archaeon]|nr:hypothetical protein [Candidatus Pacearchaeota archaeon]